MEESSKNTLNTTDISQLPNLNSSPLYSQKTTQKIRNNIIMETKELAPPPPAQNPPNLQRLPKETIAEITREVRSAMTNGGTELPQRDIPMNQNQYVQDKQIKPNYIPHSHDRKYIDEEREQLEFLKERRRRKLMKHNDDIYDEMQTPIFIMVLFFILQLPIFTSLLKRHFPSFFLADNNLTLGGQLFKTLTFGAGFYGLQKLVNYLIEWNSKMNKILGN